MKVVLVVDDHEDSRLYLETLLRARGCRVETACQGEEALAKARRDPPDLVVSDLLMPVMDGYSLLRLWKADEGLRAIPFIVYTATYTDPQDEQLALDMGADAFILKPAEPDEFWSRIEGIAGCPASAYPVQARSPVIATEDSLGRYSQALVRRLEHRSQQLQEANRRLESDIARREKAERALRESLAEKAKMAEALLASTERLRCAVEGTVEAMGAMVAARDPYTAGHEKRVTALALAIADEMQVDGSMKECLRLAGLIHDVGKLMVPIEILVRPASLGPTELALVQSHPKAAYDMLKTVDFDYPVAEVVLQHHERHDGSGYPSGLRGDEILPEASILAVADVVEAMASHRPYRASLGVAAALEEIESGAGARYGEEAAAACRRVFEKGFVFIDP